MTRDDVKKIVMIISTAYPNWKPENMTMTVDLWSALFKDYSKEVIEKATLNYIRNDTKGFAPSPGQIINCIDTGVEIMNGEQAWGLVYKALCNSNYNADEEYAKLPKECQRAIGSPDNMREIAMLDKDTTLSVEKSHFMRMYNAEVEKQRKMYKTPEGIQQALMERGRIGIAGEETQIR